MVQSQFSLSWDSYKSSICQGFSSLQQNGEFVDMTIAADGHHVKVHQILVALASPYLKELISSAPCQHPVLFLNNLLIDLVRERVSIIENKNTDTNTNSKKLAAWTDLLTSFNSMCSGGMRSLSQLKSQWSIIKMTKKKLKSEERKKLLQTGGGPPPPTIPENADDICSWLPNEFVIDVNQFDSDSINQINVAKPLKKVDVDEINKKDIIALQHGIILNIPDETPDIGTNSKVIDVAQEPLQEIQNTQKETKVVSTGSPFVVDNLLEVRPPLRHVLPTVAHEQKLYLKKPKKKGNVNKNISHRTLSLLLMYIYTGEVMVPSDHLTAFAEAAKSLHIKGLENLTACKEVSTKQGISVFDDEFHMKSKEDCKTGCEGMTLKVAENMSQMEEGETYHPSGIRSMNIPMNEGMKTIDLPAAARKIIVKKETSSSGTPTLQENQMVPARAGPKNPQDHLSKTAYVELDILDDNGTHSDDNFDTDDSFTKQVLKSEQETSDKPTSNLQFTVSIRGSLQIILNRYLYNLHSSKQAGGIRRWRCVDYRNNKCMAFVVTKGNVVISRANLHNHSFHDKKILSKIEKKSVYSALHEVYGYKMKEQAKITDNDASMEQDDFPMLEGFSAGMTEIADKTAEFITADKIN